MTKIGMPGRKSFWLALGISDLSMNLNIIPKVKGSSMYSSPSIPAALVVVTSAGPHLRTQTSSKL